jgi:signal recognition particle subunit SEC65
MMQGETMLRVANIGDEAALESIRDALDRLGVDYEHVRSEPNENYYPQTAYFYVPDDSADEVDRIMQELSEEYGFDAEVL